MKGMIYMKKLLILLSVFGAIQSCSVLNGVTRTTAEAKYLALGYRRLEDIHDELQGTGYRAKLTCTKDIQDRDWCKVNYYYRVIQ